jgi:hypothetical protein
VLGLAAGDLLFARQNYGVGHALLLDLGVVAGGLVGFGGGSLLGFTYAGPGPLYTAVAVGAVAGYLLTYAAQWSGVLPAAASAQHSRAPAIRFHVDPVALAMQVPGAARISGLTGIHGTSSIPGNGTPGPTTVPPVVSLSGGF